MIDRIEGASRALNDGRTLRRFGKRGAGRTGLETGSSHFSLTAIAISSEHGGNHTAAGDRFSDTRTAEESIEGPGQWNVFGGFNKAVDATLVRFSSRVNLGWHALGANTPPPKVEVLAEEIILQKNTGGGARLRHSR